MFWLELRTFHNPQPHALPLELGLKATYGAYCSFLAWSGMCVLIVLSSKCSFCMIGVIAANLLEDSYKIMFLAFW